MYSDSEWQKANENLQAMANAVQNVGQTYANYKLAQETREREDNATQRRVDDLKKAGLSPTLAAGSPAQSSATPSLSGSALGAWLDAKNGIEQYKQNRQLTEQAKIQTQAQRYFLQDANRQNVLNQLAFDWNLGLPVSGVGRYREGWRTTYDEESFKSHWDTNGEPKFAFDYEGSPFLQTLQNGLSMQNYAREMAGKENSWYNFNQGLNAVATGVGLGLNAFNTFGSYGLKKASQAQQFDMFQQELNRKQNYDNWRTSPHSTYYSNNRGFSSYYQYR